MKKFPIQRVSGTHDFFEDGAEKISFLESEARRYFSSLGFEEIRTPILEYSELFVKSLGVATDIVMHQMYCFEDKDGKEVVLRPEGTAPAVRLYISEFQVRKPRLKVFYIGPMFRREKPQRGRFRQFHQVGCEIFGSSSPESDAYLVFVLSNFLKLLGLSHIFEVNSVGCPTCRPEFSRVLYSFFSQKELCKDCNVRLKENPLRIFDCKVDETVVSQAPSMEKFWCGSCKEKFYKIVELLRGFEIPFSHNPRLVRGLDYYTGFVFEVFPYSSEPEKKLNAVAAGGRYDLLVEFMGGESTPACGFAIGIERLSEFIDFRRKHKRGVFIAYTDDAKEKAFDIFVKLVYKRRSEDSEKRESSGQIYDKVSNVLYELGDRIDISLEPHKSLKSQLRYADSYGFRYVFIIGKKEVLSQKITIRDLEENLQFEVSEREII